MFLTFSPLCPPPFAIWDLQGVLLILMKYITHLTNYILWHAVEYSNCWAWNKKIIAVDLLSVEFCRWSVFNIIQINNIMFQGMTESCLHSKKCNLGLGIIKKNSKALILNLLCSIIATHRLPTYSFLHMTHNNIPKKYFLSSFNWWTSEIQVCNF